MLRRLASVRALPAVFALAVAVGVMLPLAAEAARRSGGSFSGRGGFRSAPAPRAPMQRDRGGTNVVVVPGGGFGFGYGPFGYGGGFGFGTAMVVGVGAIGALVAFRAMRMAKIRRQEALESGGGGGRSMGLLGGARAYDDDDYDEGYDSAPDRAYVYKLQLGLGRSARGLQARLTKFAEEGDTGTETGLAQLLSQTSLELLREKDSIRYAFAEPAGPMTLQKGETKLNGLSLAERSRFDVERVRGAEGKVRRSEAAPTTSSEVLEYLLVTVLVATRVPLAELAKVTELGELDTALHTLGGIAPDALLGLEVIWTPADTDDALTEKELLATYPDLRSL